MSELIEFYLMEEPLLVDGFPQLGVDFQNEVQDINLEVKNCWTDFLENEIKKNLLVYWNFKHCIINWEEEELLQILTLQESYFAQEAIRKILKKVPRLALSNETAAKLFTRIILIIGKYSNQLVRDIDSASDYLRNGANQEALISFFKQLFIKYESPNGLVKNLLHLKPYEIEAILHVGQGENIHTFKNLPIPISKKESYYFMKGFPTWFEAEELVLEKCILLAKLKAVNPNNIQLRNFLQSSREYKHRFIEFLDQFSFWRLAFQKANGQPDDLKFQFYLDYLSYKVFNQPGFGLNGFSFDELMEMSIRWHNQVHQFTNDDEHIMDLNWKGRFFTEEVNCNGRTYLIEEITNGCALLKESEVMHHCVKTYARECLNRDISILSVKKKLSFNLFKNYFTIRVEDEEVLEARGKYNEPLDPYQLDVLYIWAHQNRLSTENLEI